MSKDVPVLQVTTLPDLVSSVSFSPVSSSHLLTSSWSRDLHLHEINEDLSSAVEKMRLRVDGGPLLDACWDEGEGKGSKVFTGGLWKGLYSIDLPTSTPTHLFTSAGPIRCLTYLPPLSSLACASWDSTLHIIDPRSPSAPARLSLPSKPYSMDFDAKNGRLLVSMGERKIWIWDVRKLGGGANGGEVEPWQKRESSLKFMTRTVRCMPGGEGFASGSIEGRVAVDFYDPSQESNKYAFKCHRQNIDGVDTVFPVNSIAFHPTYYTFATGGGDSIVSIWDPTAKKRLRQFPKFSSSISCLEFSRDGTRLAVGCSEFEEEGTAPAGKGEGNKVWVRRIDEECKAKK